MRKRTRVFWFLAGVGVFAFLLLNLGINESWESLCSVDLSWIGLVCLLMVVNQSLGYFKWVLMYRTDPDTNHAPLLPIFSSVLVSSMLTPARMGDVFASLAWKRMQGKVLAWSAFHRISEGMTTIGLALFILGVFFREHLTGFRWNVIAVVLVIIAAGIFSVLNRKVGHGFFRLLSRFLDKFSSVAWVKKLSDVEHKIEAQINLFYDTMHQFHERKVLGWLIGVTLLNRFVIILVNMSILSSLGVYVSWFTVLGILAASWVTMFLSPTPGGIGIGDIAPAMILSGLGYQEQAGGFIVLSRLYEFSIVFFWSLLWTFRAKYFTRAQTS